MILSAAGFFDQERFEKRPMMRMKLINGVTRRGTYRNVWDYDVHEGIEFSLTTRGSFPTV